MVMCARSMHIGGLYIDPQQALEVLGAVGGLGLTTLFGFLLVRRARATRLRQIEGLESGAPPRAPARRGLRAEDLEDDADQDEESGAKRREESRERSPERRPASTTARGADEAPDEADAPVVLAPVPSVGKGGRPEESVSPRREVAPPPKEAARPGAGARVLEFPVPGSTGAARGPSPEVEAKGPLTPDVPPARPEPKRELKIPDRRAEPAAAPAAETSPAPSAPAPKARKANAWTPGLARTRSGWVSRLGQLFAGKREIDPGLLDEIEKVLLTADIGVKTSDKLLEEMRGSLSRRELGDADSAWAFLQRRALALLSSSAPPVEWGAGRPFVLLVIGVNGSGKTTTIGKLAARLIGEGKKVLIGAGDTFRAAAAEQLEIWGKRVGAPVVRGKEGADPSSVLFDAIKRGTAEGFDVVIGDTAGRLHTKTDLMEELQKVRRVIGKAAAGAPHETWLVIDSTSGQNAIAQAQIFTQAMAVSGIVLTKLDGTAKGGVILGIADQLQIPVRFIGIGERVEDLREFEAGDFVEALFDREAADDVAQINGSR